MFLRPWLRTPCLDRIIRGSQSACGLCACTHGLRMSRTCGSTHLLPHAKAVIWSMQHVAHWQPSSAASAARQQPSVLRAHAATS